MGGKRRGKKKKQQIVSSEPAKNSSTSSNPNVEWETCTSEQQLETIIRKKLDDLYGDALYRLVSIPCEENVAIELILDRGYCFGTSDCLTNVVLNSLQILDGLRDQEQHQHQPQPFLNLKLLKEFNLQFMVYILQKYKPNLNRISACRCILMNNLNLNRAILMMDVNNNHRIEILDDEDDTINVDKDRFLALEIREMLNNLNVVDESVSEDTKDTMIANSQKMIDDLEKQLKERIRWARKKVAMDLFTAPNKNMMERIRRFHECTALMLSKKKLELLSKGYILDIRGKVFEELKGQKEVIEAEISASKLIQSEIMKKCLEFSKCNDDDDDQKKKDKKKKKQKKKNREKQMKVNLEEELAMEKKKVSKWEQDMIEIEADLLQIEMQLGEIIKEKEVAMEESEKLKRWTI